MMGTSAQRRQGIRFADFLLALNNLADARRTDETEFGLNCPSSQLLKPNGIREADGSIPFSSTESSEVFEVAGSISGRNEDTGGWGR